MSKPPSQNIRLTITVTPEVHAGFQRMADTTGMSLGRCMGEWLGDTLEGVTMITSQLERARQAPRQVVKEMRQMALGAIDEADQLLEDIRTGQKRLPVDGAGGPRPAAAGTPRPVIRGGKSPGKTRVQDTEARKTRASKASK